MASWWMTGWAEGDPGWMANSACASGIISVARLTKRLPAFGGARWMTTVGRMATCTGGGHLGYALTGRLSTTRLGGTGGGRSGIGGIEGAAGTTTGLARAGAEAGQP